LNTHFRDPPGTLRNRKKTTRTRLTGAKIAARTQLLVASYVPHVDGIIGTFPLALSLCRNIAYACRRNIYNILPCDFIYNRCNLLGRDD
jgi:hypothetical protein